MLHQTTVTVRELRYINPCIYCPHFDYDWSSYGRTFPYTNITVNHCFIMGKAAPQPRPLQTEVTKELWHIPQLQFPMATAGYCWSRVQVMHTIMLEGQNFDACSWGLMNSNYTDTDFTCNICTSLRSNRILTLCLTLQCPKKTLVNMQYETGKNDQLNKSRSSTAMGSHFTGSSRIEYTGGLDSCAEGLITVPHYGL